MKQELKILAFLLGQFFLLLSSISTLMLKSIKKHICLKTTLLQICYHKVENVALQGAAYFPHIRNLQKKYYKNSFKTTHHQA